MATRIKPAQTELYKEDFYVWTQRQADLLRARRFEDLDLQHLARRWRSWETPSAVQSSTTRVR